MNCAVHAEAPAVAYCRTCGKALCEECRRVAGGTVYCAEHSGAARNSEQAYQVPMPAAEPVHTHPKLAFALGLIPGVGAIYNGQYAKGLVHAILFGLIVSILDAGAANPVEELLGILLAVFIMYMAFEAYHTSRRRLAGLPVDEFSSVITPDQRRSSAGAISLIVIGAIFLLNTLDIIEMRQILRFWPVLLILLGVSMLRSRMQGGGGNHGQQ